MKTQLIGFMGRPSIFRSSLAAQCTCGLALLTASVVAVPSAAQFPVMPLAGTTWELVSIQSMDDAQGTTYIRHPERFRLSLATDGSAQFQLDCNRGHATWQSAASAEGVSGSLVFGPLAATKMMCPPGSVDGRWTQAIPYVRSYLLRDGRLYLSLMADGGIYAWRPVRSAQIAREVRF